MDVVMSERSTTARTFARLGMGYGPEQPEIGYHCSALVRVVGGAEAATELLFGHDTWDSYGSMVRMYKHYNFHLGPGECMGRGAVRRCAVQGGGGVAHPSCRRCCRRQGVRRHRCRCRPRRAGCRPSTTFT
jgi:hypothetical protein